MKKLLIAIHYIVVILLISLLSLIVINRFAISVFEIEYPFPREYRDGALLDIANIFLEGKNPFSQSLTLPHTYTYGFVVPLIDSILSRFIHFNLVYTHKVLVLFCIFILLILSGKQVFTITKNYIWTLMSVAVIFTTIGVSLRPEPIAITLTALVLYQMQNFKKYSHRNLLFFSLVSVLVFYIKQYFLLLFAVQIIFIYLNYTKKILIDFCIIFLFIFGISILFVAIEFPFYFSHSIINYLNMYNTHKFSYMLFQSKVFILDNLVLFIPFGLSLRFYTIHLSKNIYFLYAIIASIALCVALGQHTGTYMTYYYQFLPVPLTIFVCEFVYLSIYKLKYYPVLSLFFIFLVIFQYKTYLQPFFLEVKNSVQISQWNNALNIIRVHDPQRAYLSPHFTLSSIYNDWPILDNGQTDVFFASEIYEPKHMFLKKFFPSSSKVRPMITQWKNELNQKVIHQQFSIIVLSNESYSLIDPSLLQKYYFIAYESHIPINLGDIQYWLPISLD